MDKVTLKQIAENVGVSERLVAYALGGTGRVGSETRGRIVDEARRLGYRPNRAAKTLASGRSGLLALCLPQLATGYGDAITRIAEARARASEFDLVVTRMAGAESELGAPLIPSGLAQVDGAFVLEPPRGPQPWEIAAIGGVVILGGFGRSGLGGFDRVSIDLYPAATRIVRSHLARRPGQFAFLTGLDNAELTGEARYRAYMEGISDAGLRPCVIVVERTGDLTADAAIALLGRVREQGCPDAIMCSNDEIAIGALRALRELGRAVPDHVTVTGCDGIDFTQDANPPLTTISQPFQEMLVQAWEFLMRRIAEPNIPVQQAVLEARFIERESTGGL